MGENVPDQFPDLDDQHQIEPAVAAIPPVPVSVVGPAVVMHLPARRGPSFSTSLTTTMVHVLGADPRRTRVSLICDQDWSYSTQKQGSGVPWYAKVPLVITHADAIYASSAGTGTLTVIAEYAGQ